MVSVPWGNLAIEQLLNMPEYNYHRVAQLAEELTPIIEIESKEEKPYNLATRVINDDRPFSRRLWDTVNNILIKKFIVVRIFGSLVEINYHYYGIKLLAI